MPKRFQRPRPYAIDVSVPIAPSTGSTLNAPGKRPDYRRIDSYVPTNDPTSLDTPREFVSDIEEEEIDKKFRFSTGKTKYDVVFYFLAKLSGKSYQLLLLGGYFVAFFAIRPDTWDKLIIAVVSTILWSAISLLGMGIQGWLLQQRIKAGEK